MRARFTPAEIRVLVAMRATRGGYKAIAKALGAGAETVRDHVQAIARKLPRGGGLPPFARVQLYVLPMSAVEFAALEATPPLSGGCADGGILVPSG